MFAPINIPTRGRTRSAAETLVVGAHDADLAELVGRTNVHIFLVPR